jgi:hypothetical protein
LIQATIDGNVTSYFEWMGAGRYRPDPRSGAMHGGSAPLQEMFYGCDDTHLYIRLDGAGDARVTVEFDSGPVGVDVAADRIIEIRARRAGPRFRVGISHNGLPPVTVPANGWIEIM